MPAKKKPRKKTGRCAYRESQGHRCPRQGTGNPYLCAQHREIAAAEMGTHHIREAVDGLASGARVKASTLMGALGELVGMFTGGVRPQPATSPAGPLFPPWSFSNPPHPHPNDPMASVRAQMEADARARAEEAADVLRERMRETVAARNELGFAPGDQLTLEIIKQRQRSLAKKYHPDRKGGSLEKMIRVNAAVDVLVAALETN